ncbi:MAG: glycosyltransferase [Candidatus Hadarchaeota archaeon]
MISVIIPTLNEGAYLERILIAIKDQTHQNFEIIVSDSHSDDNTQEIAKKYGAKLVQSERLGPAVGRNRGAEIAKGEILVFLDADTIPSKKVLETMDKIPNERKDVVGGTCALYPSRGSLLDWLILALANAALRLIMLGGTPQDTGCCSFYRREVFEKVGGVREDLKLNEAHDLAIRTKPYGKFIYIKVPAFTSMRRYKKEGYLKTIMIYIDAALSYFQSKQVPKSKFVFEPVR